MSRVVILGGTGFIGMHAAERLRRAGWDVEALGHADADLVDPDRVIHAAARWDHATTVVFCAGLTPDRDASWHAARANILMAKHVADAVPKGGWRGVLFLSSSAVYGRPAAAGSLHEDTPLKPEGPYGFSKVESESILAERCWSRNTPFLALRPSIVFGGHDQGKSLIGRWTSAIRRGEPVAVKGKGAARLDFLPAEDLCEIIADWVRKPSAGALNAASGQSFPVTQWIDLIADAVGQKAVVDFRSRSQEPEFDQVFDISRLRLLFPGWTPREVRSEIQAYARERTRDLSE